LEAIKQSLIDKLSVEQIKVELMRTAFGRRSTLLSRFDPRVLLGWYTILAILPWFLSNKFVLLGLLVPVLVLTFSSKVSPLVLFILGLGLVSEISYILIGSLLFGGSLDAVWPLMTLTLKLLIISLASIAVFNSMDPERFSDALLSLGVPGQFSFGVSYGYRMLPILIEEYHNLFYSFRLRGKAPGKRGLLGWRSLVYLVRTAVYAFYPLMLNTAKRTRTTVEALEVKGFTYALVSPEARKLKLAYLRVGAADIAFLGISLLYLIALCVGGHWVSF
jgi:ABC-type cobalt transport system, permease component CbiQ and related transporters